MENKTRGGFTGSLGFILAAAGSAIGLGNLWRFPYLAAKDGGGLFICIYIILAFTFGFSLLTAEIAIGRKTGVGPLLAYKKLNKKFGFLGIIATLVPLFVFSYYCVIGGWVTKYATVYAMGQANDIYSAGSGNFFESFVTSQWAPVIFLTVYMALSAVVVAFGVEKGIENVSKILLPILLVIIIAMAVFSLTLSSTDVNGETRTALQGLKIYLIPDFKNITFKSFLNTLLDASGQLFYSLSIAMGIMIAFGSYVKKDSNLIQSVNRIAIFDSAVAILAGMIIIPTVFAFKGREGLSAAGPALMFESLPEIFEQMGFFGNIIGALFFVLALFAALTSSISLMEAVVTSAIDRFHMSRIKATVIVFAVSLALGVIVCFGYNIFYFDIHFPNGTNGQILDLFDYITNSILLPVIAVITCIMVAWVGKPKDIIDEIKIGMAPPAKFYREKLFVVMIRFVAPLILVVILLQAFGLFSFAV